MTCGQIVKVFSWQDTCIHLESKAILLEKTFETALVQLWIVKLLRTGQECQRVFYNNKMKFYKS